ncbi:MAG: hypothetical protein NVS4B8_22590 [Herpetosiphon sp.]
MDRGRGAMKVYPIALTGLAGRRCVVVGGGAVAERKVGSLLEAGAHVEVISPDLSEELAAWYLQKRITYHARRWIADDLAEAWLVIAATDDPMINRSISHEAERLRILCNVADDPAGGSFHTLGAVRIDDVMIAVGTGGASPALASLIRRKLLATFGPEWGELAAWLRHVREQYGATLAPRQRTALYRALARDEVLGWLRNGDRARVAHYTEQTLNNVSESNT